MSETNAETKSENNVEVQEKAESTPRKGKRPSSIASKLAKEAESILKGFGEKEDAPEGRRTTRSSTRGSIAPPACTPPPVKKERKSSASINNSTSGSRRGRPKKGGGDDVKVNSDEQKEEETNSVEETTDVSQPTDKVNDVADVEMKDESIAEVNSDGNAVVASTTDAALVDAEEANTETNSDEPVKESAASTGGASDKLSEASATAVLSGSTPSSTIMVGSNSTVPVPAAISPSNASVVSASVTATANGTVENTCKRINPDEKLVNDSTGSTDSNEDVAKKASPAINEEKISSVSAGENTTTASPFSDESNKSISNSSETSANQTSVTLSSND